jgi:hypothetical protein
MPYSIRKIGKNKYQVYNTATGEIHSKGTTKKKAEGQFRLLQGVHRKELLGDLEGGMNQPNLTPYISGDMRDIISSYNNPRDMYINMLFNIRQRYLNHPPPHETPPNIVITPEILQNPLPMYEELDARYEHYRDVVDNANTGGMPDEEWDNIVSWVSGSRDDDDIYADHWSTRQELETYSPANLRYILTVLGVNLDNGQPSALTDHIVSSQLSRLEFVEHDPIADFNNLAQEDPSDTDSEVSDENEGAGRRRKGRRRGRRMRGGMFSWVKSVIGRHPTLTRKQIEEAERFANELMADPNGIDFEGTSILPKNVRKELGEEYYNRQLMGNEDFDAPGDAGDVFADEIRKQQQQQQGRGQYSTASPEYLPRRFL